MGFIKNRFLSSMGRQEEKPYFVYFRLSHCPGLNAEPYSFKSNEATLNGYFYHYDKYNKDVIVIFCHGIGGGHSSYLKEINELAKMGYNVLAYDNTGCVNSEGDSILGLSNSLKDLDYAIQSLRNNEEYQNKKIYVIGHSWGGFAASNIPNYQNVDKIIAISPFISLSSEYHHLFKGPLGLIVSRLIKYEKESVGKWANSTAIEALNKENIKGLIIHSKDDKTVPYKKNSGVLQGKIKNPNIKYYIVEGKGHHPHYTKEAADYFDKVFSNYDKGLRDKTLSSQESLFNYFKDKDFDKMTIQDPVVWKVIEDFLKRD